ncbi:MAG: hypothetical protein IMZ53_11695 [Thermoplasmata archaeon]|nr:hypothetical protein [Thermoplasmata archaeon]
MPSPFNDQEFLAYSDEHIAYEVERFFWLAALLSDPQTKLSAVSADDALRLNHALIEAFALHLRNLLEFLYDHENQDHIVAEQFCGPGVWKGARQPKPPILGAVWGRANEEIAHLTDKRKPREETKTPWPFKEISDEIRPNIECLAANALEGRLSPKVRQAIEAKPEPMSIDKRVGIGPSGSSAPQEMPVVGITGTSKFLSEDPGPPKERK